MDESQFRIEHEAGEAGTTLRLIGALSVSQTANAWKKIEEALSSDFSSPVQVDVASLTSTDSLSAAAVLTISQRCQDRGLACEVVGADEKLSGLLGLLDAEALRAEKDGRTRPPRMFATIGEAALTMLGDVRQIFVFVGDIILAFAKALARPSLVRWRDTLAYMDQCGPNALPIVALISFLIGLIMAFQAAMQLHKFGADIFVADLVGVAVTRELGPLMTAIILAGRSGSAFAAEIGTMKVSEEVDALSTMGLDTTRFLVVPKMLALTLMLPLLTLFADLVAIIGGALVSVLALDIALVAYVNETLLAVGLWRRGVCHRRV